MTENTHRSKYNLAQINVAKMIGVSKADPIMKEFVDNLDRVYALAEKSKGFVWRKKDESNSETSFNPYHDEQVIINISIWEDIESLEAFTYNTFHSDFIKRKREWFMKYGQSHHAMWWIPEGKITRVEECLARLKFLQKKGPTQKAFDFKNRLPKP